MWLMSRVLGEDDAARIWSFVDTWRTLGSVKGLSLSGTSKFV